MADDTTQITDVYAVGVPVTDQDRALAFYVGKLGFETLLDVPYGTGGRWVEVAPPGGHTHIALVATRDSSPAGGDTGIRLTTPDADTLNATLRGAGVDVDDVLHWPGAPPMFAFRDQDANTLEIIQLP